MSQPLVSVVMITYNHEEFIKQAIDAILMQQCTFPFEVVIANDCSPDNTDNIIQNYIQNHPKGNLIRYFKHEKNLGMMPNFFFALKQAKSKYIAICEGDDYWTDPLKLQKQTDFMEQNPDHSVIFHQVQILEGGTLGTIYPKTDEVSLSSSMEDLSKYNYIPMLSVLFKNPSEYPEYILKSPMGDYPLHLYNAEKGEIRFIPEVMGIYRKGVGIWSTQDSLKKSTNTINTLNLIIEHYKDSYPTVVKNITQHKNGYLYHYLKEKNKDKGISKTIHDLQKDPIFSDTTFKTKFIFIIKYLLRK